MANTKKTTASVEKTPKRKVIGREIEVSFINNSNAIFTYQDKKTMNTYKMSNYGDIDYITVDELLRMKNTSPRILTEYMILLVDVLDDEINIDDVVRHLGLTMYYDKVFSTEEVDEMLIKYPFAKFEKLFKPLNDFYKAKIIERAVDLFKEKKFTDYQKMQLIKEVTKNPDFFITLE